MSSDVETSSTISDNDRLIATLQTCFQDLFARQEEQTEKIQKALEALKSQAPIADNKTAFWNAYMKLADEHDKEFQQKFGTDLDTSLIFAGLFSAVSSAFIIQIQSQFVTGTPGTKVIVAQGMLYISLFTTLMAALLAVLGKQWIMCYQAAGSRGTIEERGLERQRKLDGLLKWKFDVVLQMFPVLLQLAMGLFSIALAVYLWTVHPSIAIIVLTLTLMGFGSYLILLASAIISPDSPFQTPVAPILIQAFAVCRYFLGITSGVVRRYTVFLRKLSSPILQATGSYCRFSDSTHFLPHFSSQIRCETTAPSDSYDGYFFKPRAAEAPAVLWVLETSTDPTIITAAAELAVDLQWSLDLDLTFPMTRLAQTFNSCFDRDTVRKGMVRRAIACGQAYCCLRLISRAAGHSSKSQHLLLHGYFWNGTADHEDSAQIAQLFSVVQIIHEWPRPTNKSDDSDVDRLKYLQWAFHVIPSLDRTVRFGSVQKAMEHFLDQIQDGDNLPTIDQSTFTSYLCCINSFLSPVDPRVMTQMDKRLSHFQDILMLQLFKNLQGTPIDNFVIARIIQTTARLGEGISVHRPRFWLQGKARLGLMRELLQFCNGLPQEPGWLDAVVAATALVRLDNLSELDSFQKQTLIKSTTIETRHRSSEVAWIYIALEQVQPQSEWEMRKPCAWDESTVIAIDSLMQVLACSGEPGTKRHPSLDSLQIILDALFTRGKNSASAFLVLYSAQSWFLDPDLLPILQEADVWFQLGRIALKYPHIFAWRYFELGANISSIPSWQPVIYQDLATWITLFSGDPWGSNGNSRQNFLSVINNVWVPDCGVQYKFGDETEKSWALALKALANFWKRFEFEPMNTRHLFNLARCTISTALQVQYRVPFWELAQEQEGRKQFKFRTGCRAVFASELGEALIHAARNVQKAIAASDMSRKEGSNLVRVARVLRAFGHKIGTEFELGSGVITHGGTVKQYKDWQGLKAHFMGELDALETDIQVYSVS